MYRKETARGKNHAPAHFGWFPPHYRNEEERVSTSSRRGVRYLCFAANTPACRALLAGQRRGRSDLDTRHVGDSFESSSTRARE
eukprot:3617999-Pyramimonas_sp.AAC.1